MSFDSFLHTALRAVSSTDEPLLTEQVVSKLFALVPFRSDSLSYDAGMSAMV